MLENKVSRFSVSRLLARVGLALLLMYGAGIGLTGSPVLDVSAASAQTGGTVPGRSLGNISDSQFWRGIRKGICGTVTIPDQQAACLVQSDGDEFRAFRNGKMAEWGAWLMLAMVIILALFFALRGRIKIEHGPHPEGRTIERFNALERFTHWLTASSFIVLALTGLNVLYGKVVLMPILGKDVFATITMWGKMAHNYIAWAFMLGIILMFVLWVKDNIPSVTDLKWLAKGGGLFSEGVHPDSTRFNAGQKFIFWSVVVGGGSLSVSGIALLFPYEIAIFADTFKIVNVFGFDFPTVLTPLQEMQYSLMWHGIVGLVMIAIVIGHIYIGSVGMEGAFDAVGDGQVDVNWAKEHHNLWVEEVEGKSSQQAAE